MGGGQRRTLGRKQSSRAFSKTIVIVVYIPNELRGLSMRIFIGFSSIVAVGIASSLVPLASSLLGGSRYLNLSLALVTAITSVIGLAGFAIAARRLPADERKPTI